MVLYMPNKIQPREYSKGGGMGDILYITATPVATSMSVACAGAVVSDGRTSTG